MRLCRTPQGASASRRRQSGAVVVVVLVMMLLAVLTALGTSRTQWLSERIVGSESDFQRAFAAAEAVLRDAELDIRGLRGDGITPCHALAAQTGCRTAAAGTPYFPQSLADYETVAGIVSASGQPCMAGSPSLTSSAAANSCWLAAELEPSRVAAIRAQRNRTPNWLGSVGDRKIWASPAGSCCASVNFHCHTSNCASWFGLQAETLQSSGVFAGVPQPVWYGLI